MIESPPDWMVRSLRSPAPAFLVIFAFVLGAVALWLTPREEEPQIVVPMADVVVTAPGLDPGQMARQVAAPLEKLLAQIPGVEHVYARSDYGQTVVTVRFYVGEDRESALVRLYNQLFSNTDRIPALVADWVIKPIEIDDVPIVIATLWSEAPERVDDHALHRLAQEVGRRLQRIEDTNRIDVVGGRPREWRIELDPEALAGRRTTVLAVVRALAESSRLLSAGSFERRDAVLRVDAGGLISSADELGELVVHVVDGVPVHLTDVARVVDGPAEAEGYGWLRFGRAHELHGNDTTTHPAVSLAVAKQRGANAVRVAEQVRGELEAMQADFFPPSVRMELIRNYGQTANAKIGELVGSLAVAVLTVVVFIGVTLGWRAAAVVALAVPVCYGITLGLDLWAGYTINRVTLFALILAIGLLVDDPITGIDNIDRHLLMDGDASTDERITRAVWEIRWPLVMSTIAIVLAFLPMSFITGMMGPYMAPMAFNVPVTVVVSTLVTFLITPWLARHLVSRPDAAPSQARGKDLYHRLLGPLLDSRRRSKAFLAVVGLLFVLACVLPALRMVPLKLLPHDNKDELQLVIDLPEGSTLERTDAVARRFADWLAGVAEVKAVAGFTGRPSPVDFNGLIRQYYLREGPHLADLRITLAPKDQRAQQSHALALRLRPELERIAREENVDMALVEVPPGPPVRATVVLEIHGDATTTPAELAAGAKAAARRFRQEPGVVDVDTSLVAPHDRLVHALDREKAALSGVSTADVAETLEVALDGVTVAHAQAPREADPLPIRVRLAYPDRIHPGGLESVTVEGRAGLSREQDGGGLRAAPVPQLRLGELGGFRSEPVAQPRLRKDLDPVVYVYAEVAGRTPAEVIADMSADLGAAPDADAPPPGERTFLNNGGGIGWQLPKGVRGVWAGEGEWWITLRVFRDLGIAFGAALLGIFMVLWIQTGSSALTGIIMTAIPLTVVGIMPGFWLLNAFATGTIGDYADPVLFTATAMIGMIALAGIVVRNALILIEFIRSAIADGMPLRDALLEAGSVRMRPVLLTAGTTLLGNLVITLDPIFSGLAWAIIFGILASTLFTLAVVPVVYLLIHDEPEEHAS